MDMIVNIILFFIVAIIYLHITQQYRRSEDLEIFEMDYTTGGEFNTACELKQPMIFEYRSIAPEFYRRLDTVKSSEANEVRVKESADYWTKGSADDPIDSVVLSYSAARTLTNTDTNARYFSDGNADFIEEVGLTGAFQENDDILKPSFTVKKQYDLMFGSPKGVTPMVYHTEDRRFLSVHRGQVRVKMTPYKSIKHLNCIHDYHAYEFRSRINVWSSENPDLEKVKFLDFEVNPGHVLFVPPYWFYSIQYPDEPDAVVTCLKYSSAANILANLKHYGKYYYNLWQGSPKGGPIVQKKVLTEPSVPLEKEEREPVKKDVKNEDIGEQVLLPSHESLTERGQ